MCLLSRHTEQVNCRNPDHYVEWFLPFGMQMLSATADTGWLVLNIKNRVAKNGALQGQRHPYVYELVLALLQPGWRWLEPTSGPSPTACPVASGPRTKDSFEYLYAFAKGPGFDQPREFCVAFTAPADG